MPERIQEILNRVIAWWKKFNTKQKTLMISITAAVIMALVILVYVMSQPTMVTVSTCEDATQAAKVKDLLDGDGVYLEQSNNGMVFSVKQEDEARARILLGSNDIPTQGYSIDDVTSGGFSVTEADKDKRYQVYLEDKMTRMLEGLDPVETATVKLYIPADEGTMVSRQEDTYAWVTLFLKSEMDEDWAAGVALAIANSVGNKTADSITIINGEGYTLYSGGDSSSMTGTANSQLSYQTKAENKMKSSIKDVLLGTNVYNNVAVGLHLELDFSTVKETDRHVYTDEGRDQGLLSQESYFESDAQGGAAGTPGTDSNDDDVTYVLQDGTITSQNTVDYTKVYDPSVTITETEKAVGTMDRENSTIAVVANNYVYYNEDALRADGTLDEMTFEQFKAQNNERTRAEVDPDFLAIVSKATSVPEENIEITAYNIPFFEYSASNGRSVSDYLQIALAVLILGMLGYVVFRSTRKEESAELEPELSVEALLETTREAVQEDIDDIGFNEKSEVRVMIEKFVDDNPEAVAALLRNWLNEEWN